MSRGWNLEDEFLYCIPSDIMCRFYEVMGSLEDSDWHKFATLIVRDLTQLRLLEQQSHWHRTESVMWHWISRNGKVGELLSILDQLKLLRARNIILSWQKKVQQDPPPPPALHPPYHPSPPCPDPVPQPPLLPERIDKKTKRCQEITTLFTPVAPQRLLPHPSSPPSPPQSLISVNSEHLPSRSSSSANSRSSVTDDGRAMPSVQPDKSSVISAAAAQPNLLCWPYEEVVLGTQGFSESFLIGEGGFGRVFKATMRNTDYAVKKLKQDAELEWNIVKQSFMAEVQKLSQLQHPNIVSLAGYCVEKDVYCLIYVYLPNGSLENRLHKQYDSLPLSWLQRLDILLGSARAIQFLHACQPSLIHGDVKSANILLDETLTPKLGDFGLARFSRYSNKSGKSMTVGQTQTVRGTLAYLPDEYVKQGTLTVELDTYSFGVVMLEILTGQEAIQNDSNAKTKYLKDLINEEEEEDTEELQNSTNHANRALKIGSRICRRHLDPRPGRCPEFVSLELCQLAYQCLLNRWKKRPKMAEVYKKLESLRDQLQQLSLSLVIPEVSLCDPASPPSELAESFRGLLLTPEENTYKFSPGCRVPPSKTFSSTKGHWGQSPSRGQHCAISPQSALPTSDSRRNSFPLSSSCRNLLELQSHLNYPVESDESLVDTSHSSSQDLGARTQLNSDRGQESSMFLGPEQPGLQNSAWDRVGCELPVGNGDESCECSGGSECPGSSCAAEGAVLMNSSQGNTLPQRQIVLNQAKEKIMRRLALYAEGRIDSAELLSSEFGSVLRCSRGPEESDDFC
uniref:Interleukin-1 receptor-associated kinase 1 n=1 Tax=Geotrypetes seraphini TaxID=260995 RepID=A0A6P8PRS9_GEOSA|nr:interleukin-1 receptor-associated kinase 1 [Geotrypetes seraphini]